MCHTVRMAKLNKYQIVVEVKSLRTFEVTGRTRTEAAMAFASNPDLEPVSYELVDQKVRSPHLIEEGIDGDAPTLFAAGGDAK